MNINIEFQSENWISISILDFNLKTDINRNIGFQSENQISLTILDFKTIIFSYKRIQNSHSYFRAKIIIFNVEIHLGHQNQFLM